MSPPVPPNSSRPWTALVTGGASGIGAATVRKLASRGINVLIADVSDGPGQKLAEQVSKEFNVEAVYQHVDVRNESEIEAMVKTVVEKWGRLDYACNAAGTNREGIEQKEDEMLVSGELLDL